MDEGSSARQILASVDGPVRTLVVGIVDAVEMAAPAPAPNAPGADPTPARRTRTRRRASA
jgi:hypothetical protein